ncbi:MAG: hypothetical protein UU54_C0004G0022 [Candidatus Yanofskybacteria bacterium GW2011_GWA2_41_22]|uniref:Peptidase MA-like domain-containing protein n=5 Tax=Parcubacteria group TaxID=1794811 RepID=A0A1F8HVT0_9BACT|nr:MAG: hypothetical protein UU54_C0004G0022 [Candidatus Yanofskybacteria bacterium GW2011_GWA2_41_22]KKS25753.1 MAG: hypothetical protein UU83_C0002G0001 [Candidatus Jorgensenbacteria bacterium GW2011_GWF2_41_8]KKS27648.1 MAG: hypothetical protein UU84_C0002G0001 [Candidatus Yanofskybacteria bacterium GW2011_GWC2_41_9]OGM98685.1 MAG: hypothetical protein A2736_00455 [Candidatus Yanofskybacteria bacterium RIFCSPHIGHO2_01_FULL_41_27]OGN10014.1 MAG: hypothetical protein A3C64_01015 [Candidatus Ya
MPEKSSSFERVVGVPDKQRGAEILDDFKDNFEGKRLREIKEHEIPKTPEDIEVINLANEATNEIRRKYGFSNFDIPPENIVIVDEPHWGWGEGGDNAYFSSTGQIIATPYSGQNFNFARLMFHEMLHFKSFGSLRVSKDGKTMTEDRSGLQARMHKGKMYFKNLNEAVTETLTKNFITGLFRNKDQRFTKEVQELEQRGIAPENLGEGMIFGYGQQREALNALVDKIFEKNGDIFDSKEEVFGIFVKSIFNNNLLALGKLIDKTFGVGTFRKLGRLDSDQDKLTKFVSSL